MVSVSRVPAGGMKRLPVGDGGSSVGAATCTRLSSEIRAWIHVIWPCAPSRIRQIHETPTRREPRRGAPAAALPLDAGCWRPGTDGPGLQRTGPSKSRVGAILAGACKKRIADPPGRGCVCAYVVSNTQLGDVI